jgi:hypothetical protein
MSTVRNINLLLVAYSLLLLSILFAPVILDYNSIYAIVFKAFLLTLPVIILLLLLNSIFAHLVHFDMIANVFILFTFSVIDISFSYQEHSDEQVKFFFYYLSFSI